MVMDISQLCVAFSLSTYALFRRMHFSAKKTVYNTQRALHRSQALCGIAVSTEDAAPSVVVASTPAIAADMSENSEDPDPRAIESPERPPAYERTEAVNLRFDSRVGEGGCAAVSPVGPRAHARVGVARGASHLGCEATQRVPRRKPRLGRLVSPPGRVVQRTSRKPSGRSPPQRPKGRREPAGSG